MTTTKKTEIEAKFICPDGLTLEAILDIVPGMGLHYVREIPCLQTDTYLDTPEYTLLKSLTALRIRQRGENYVGACKTSGTQTGAIFERKECEWTLSHDEIKLWTEEKNPSVPPSILAEFNLHGQTLRKVLVVETQRSTAIIKGNEGLKIELSLDDVAFRGHKGKQFYREIEAELLDGSFEQFKDITNRLQNLLHLQPAIDSKYKQGMILVGKYRG
jgi:inorganic triphosphatase YgiF